MLEGKKVVLLVGQGYEDLECWYPKIRLKEEGAKVTVCGKREGTYQSKHGYPIAAEKKDSDLDPDDYDGVVIPGGRGSPDRLRTSKAVTDFVKEMDEQGKVVAAICHAGWVPISAGILDGRSMTCYHSIKDDLINAGADYKDQPVVVDGNLISSRHPGDLPDFCKAIIEKLSS